MKLNIMNTSNTTQVKRPEMIAWYWGLRGVVSCTAVVGNILVMALIIRCRRLRVTQNGFIFALALADMLVGTLITPCDMICTFWCVCDPDKLHLTFDIVIQLSVTSLCAMTFERYVAISRPLRYRDFMTKKTVLIILLSCWSFGAVFPVTGYTLRNNLVAANIARILNTIFLQISPPILLVLVYILMVYIARKHEKKDRIQLHQLDYNYEVKHRDKQSGALKDRASVKMMGVVIICFAICYLLAVIRSFCRIANTDVPDTVTQISRIMILTNSSVNFVVYAFLKKDFRQEIHRIIKSN